MYMNNARRDMIYPTKNKVLDMIEFWVRASKDVIELNMIMGRKY